MARATNKPKPKSEPVIYLGINLPDKGLSFGSVFTEIPKGIEGELVELIVPVSEIDKMQKDTIFMQKIKSIAEKYRG